jgi:hypothetical protein
MRCEDDDALEARFLLRCGECGVWREAVLGLWASHALERRLRRDRRRIARDLRRLERAGSEFELPPIAPGRRGIVQVDDG